MRESAATTAAAARLFTWVFPQSLFLGEMKNVALSQDSNLDSRDFYTEPIFGF